MYWSNFFGSVKSNSVKNTRFKEEPQEQAVLWTLIHIIIQLQPISNTLFFNLSDWCCKCSNLVLLSCVVGTAFETDVIHQQDVIRSVDRDSLSSKCWSCVVKARVWPSVSCDLCQVTLRYSTHRPHHTEVTVLVTSTPDLSVFTASPRGGTEIHRLSQRFVDAVAERLEPSFQQHLLSCCTSD